jgi:hypothetical protein
MEKALERYWTQVAAAEKHRNALEEFWPSVPEWWDLQKAYDGLSSFLQCGANLYMDLPAGMTPFAVENHHHALTLVLRPIDETARFLLWQHTPEYCRLRNLVLDEGKSALQTFRNCGSGRILSNGVQLAAATVKPKQQQEHASTVENSITLRHAFSSSAG